MPYRKIRKAPPTTRTAWRNLPRGWAMSVGPGGSAGRWVPRRRGGAAPPVAPDPPSGQVTPLVHGRSGLRGGRGAPLLQGHQEGHEVDELLGRELLTEGGGHHAGREARHRALRRGVQDLPHHVVDRLGRAEVRVVGPDLAGRDV